MDLRSAGRGQPRRRRAHPVQLAQRWLHTAPRPVSSESALREALAEGHWDVALSTPACRALVALRPCTCSPSLRCAVPAIAVSGAISDDTAVATMAACAVDYVLKDNFTRLAPAVERAVAGAELRRRERRAAEEARQSKFAVPTPPRRSST